MLVKKCRHVEKCLSYIKCFKFFITILGIIIKGITGKLYDMQSLESTVKLIPGGTEKKFFPILNILC